MLFAPAADNLFARRLQAADAKSTPKRLPHSSHLLLRPDDPSRSPAIGSSRRPGAQAIRRPAKPTTDDLFSFPVDTDSSSPGSSSPGFKQFQQQRQSFLNCRRRPHPARQRGASPARYHHLDEREMTSRARPLSRQRQLQRRLSGSGYRAACRLSPTIPRPTCCSPRPL